MSTPAHPASNGAWMLIGLRSVVSCCWRRAPAELGRMRRENGMACPLFDGSMLRAACGPSKQKASGWSDAIQFRKPSVVRRPPAEEHLTDRKGADRAPRRQRATRGT
jgi:hypothetical protein